MTSGSSRWPSIGRAVAVTSAVVAAGDNLSERLVTALDALLDQAEPLVPKIAGLRWPDPDAVHELDAAGQAAFHELLTLAPKHDAVRAGAVALYDQLVLVARRDPTRRGAATDWPIDRFLGGGSVTGPAAGRGAGDQRYSREWTFRPVGHSVQRIVIAVRERREELEATEVAEELVTATT